MRVVHLVIGSSLVWFLAKSDDMLYFVTRPMVECIDYKSLVGFMCGLVGLIHGSFGGKFLFYSL
jgi:hypothetical protein